MTKTQHSLVSYFPNKKILVATAGLLALAACDESGSFNIQEAFSSNPAGQETAATGAAAVEFTEKDVESPDVFSASEAGLWDGRPSLGGVWVAHPDVGEPERVMIRNQSNGQFVVGALFRRERDIPGPRLQISSDAAKALDVLAGAPVELEVVALRKERIEVAQPEPVVAEADAETLDAPAEIQESTLDPIIAAGAAIDAADPTPVAAPAPVAAPQTPAPQSTLPVSRLSKPYIQVGIYNREENAKRVATQMRSAGMVPTVLSQDSNGKAFWRVVVGPATTSNERRKIQNQVKAEGFSDAYAVTN